MKVGDLVKHYGDHDLGIIVEIRKPFELDKKGSVLVYFMEEDSLGWYSKNCLEVMNEER